MRAQEKHRYLSRDLPSLPAFRLLFLHSFFLSFKASSHVITYKLVLFKVVGWCESSSRY